MMNNKISRIEAELAKTKQKISGLQAPYPGAGTAENRAGEYRHRGPCARGRYDCPGAGRAPSGVSVKKNGAPLSLPRQEDTEK